jgi:hypothetical protein
MKNLHILQEQRLWLTINGKRVASGQFDRCVYKGKIAVVQDFKTGHSMPDEASQSAQLKVLGVLVALELVEVEEVIVQIISFYGVTEARYDLEQLSEAHREILKTLEDINDPNAGFSPSVEACKYCGAVTICGAVKNLFNPITKLQYSELPDGERAAQLLDEIQILKGHIAEVEKFYEKRLTDPSYTIPHYTLAPNAPRREVTDWDVAIGRLSEYLDKADLFGAAAYRLGDIEKSLARKLKIKLKDARAKLNEILNDVLTFHEPKSSLKRG